MPAPSGSTRHGNYHAYYTKRTMNSLDPRLDLIPPELIAGKTILDVGCNEGWVTCELAQVRGASHVMGVDIDESLVRLAWKRRRTLWSLQKPSISPDAPQSSGESSAWDDYHYFPASLEHSFAALPIPPPSTGTLVPQDSADTDMDSMGRGQDRTFFPHNVTFQAADWMATGIDMDTESYDLVLGFSITKWIHLNGGDRAIREFFSRAHSVLKPGGAFVIEPQAWETYAKARRMNPALRESMNDLHLRPENFDSVLLEVGFGHVEKLGVTGEGGFARPLLFARK